MSIPEEVQHSLAARFKARRLARNLTQEGLAARAGVSWSSLKRFEYKGLIAFDALLRLALVLECLDDFARVGAADGLETRTLDEILEAPKQRRKGMLK